MQMFNQLKSVKKLKKLAQSPIDLTKKNILTPKRIEQMIAKNLDFSLFYATEQVTPQVMRALLELAEETHVLEKMRKMQSGQVMNFIKGYESENRQVLHTAMRDFFEDKNPSKASITASAQAYAEIEKLKNFLQKIDEQKAFQEIVQIGIGGSDLGPRALYMALEKYSQYGRKAHFVSNVDPDDMSYCLKNIDPERTLFVVVSKSGSTLETLTNETLVRNFLKEKNINPESRIIAVTGEGSPMDDKKKYLESFYIWDYIGGRYSATSMVGGVTLAFCLGIGQYKQILQGASEMDKVALSNNLSKNLPLLSALLGIWNRNFLNMSTVAIIPYSQALRRFTAHLQQCDMESNGKQVDQNGKFVSFQTGPIIWGEPGTNGQHSFYQLIHQGTVIVPIEFIGFKQNQYEDDFLVQNTFSQEKLLSNLFAQSIALAIGQKNKNPNKTFLGNRPNRILLTKKLDPKTMGALLSYYENKVAFQGFIWNINSFDQEGVQLGKVLANKMLELFSSKREGKKPKTFALGEAFFKNLENI